MFNFDSLRRDLKMALRSLSRTRGLAITVILARSGHRRQRRDFQSRAWSTPSTARESRRKPLDLYPPERARTQPGKRKFLCSRNSRFARRRYNDQRIR